jgi:hypothetical protein
MPELAEVFTTTEAVQSGYAIHEVRRQLRRGEWLALRRGVFCSTRTLHDAESDPVSRHRLLALAEHRALRRPAWVSHSSAALLYGLPLPRSEPSRVFLTAESGVQSRTPRAEIQVCAVPTADRAELDGLPIASVARTVVDLARHYRPDDAVAIGDCALHRGLTDLASLAVVLASCASWRGIIAARTAIARMDGRRESWLESKSAMVIAHHGIVPPEPQVLIADDAGPFARVDFLWHPPGVVGEADGAVKYGSTDGLRPLIEEKRRQERLEALGFVVVRWDTGDILRRAQQTCERIHAALDRAWLARAAGVPTGGRIIRHPLGSLPAP